MDSIDFDDHKQILDAAEERIAELEKQLSEARAENQRVMNQRDQARADFANMATHPSNPLYAENKKFKAQLSEMQEGLNTIADQLDKFADAPPSEFDLRGWALACRGYALAGEAE